MRDDADDALPFAGLKVIDCASFIAAPCAATVLSDFGADVIKIEPLEGDAYRELYRMPGMPAIDRNFAWDLDSRNKRSIALDLKSPDALAVLHKLVAQADVFITNLPLPARSRLNIGYEALGPLNPRMIYASFTAYGENGPEAHKTGFDSTAYWARSGLMDLMRADHRTPPARSVAGFGDHPSGMALYGAIVTALYRRLTTGRGGLVDSSLLANGLWANSFLAQARLYGATIPPRPPRELAANSLTNGYRCGDGRWLNLVLLNEARQFRPLLEAMGRPELADDPRFATQMARFENAPALTRIFDELFAEHDLAEWRQRFDAAGITFGIVGTLDDILHDEQMRSVEAVVPGHDGVSMTINSPINIEGVRKVAPGPAPAVGEHGAEILREVGYGDAEIQRLRDLKVLL
ncbi:MAG: CaiB/BaiF CoA-transferase family protein [Burkholderiaceae bacterium]